MKIAIDIDDVLAGFYPTACRKYGIELRETDIWDVKGDAKFIGPNWNDMVADKELWENMDVITKPEEIEFDFTCYISAFPPERFAERLKWLKKNGFPDKPLIYSNDKLKTCRQLGIDVLIDDKWETIESLKGTEVHGIWFRPPYMTYKGQEFNSFSTISMHIEWLEKIKSENNS